MPAEDRQARPHHCNHRIAYISQIAKHRHKNTGIAVGIVRTVTQLSIQTLKILYTGILMAEHLHHFLAFHHFLYVAVQVAHICLLFHKIISAF